MTSVFFIVSRVCLSLIFILSAIHKLAHWSESQNFLALKNIPLPSLFLSLAVLMMLIGGLGLLFNVQISWAAILLIVFLIPVTLIFHTDFSNPDNIVQLLKDIFILGTLLMIANGQWVWEK